MIRDVTGHGPGRTRVLVAGVGNIFFTDDGFGPAVARRLAAEVAGGSGWTLPGQLDVRVEDYGIRGMHLAYDLLDGFDALVLVDALPAPLDGDSSPGNIKVMRIRAEDLDSGSSATPAARRGMPAAVPGVDPHGMDPLVMLRHLRSLGGTLPVTYLVGCVAANADDGIGLSDEVSQAVPAAIAAVRGLLAGDLNHGLTGVPATAGVHRHNIPDPNRKE